jgi:hypothetical protein
MIHTSLVLPSVPSFIVLPVVGAFNIGTSSSSLLAVVDDGVAANEGIPSVPTTTVNVVKVIVVIVSIEKIMPRARGLRVMRLKTIGRGRGGHPLWAQPLFVMIK